MVLVAIAIATSNLLLAVVVSLIVCFVLYVPQKVVALDDFFNLIVRGFADMLPILILLVVAFVLQKVTEGMGMTDFIISVAKPLLWGPVFPAIAFVLVAALTFTTGSLWGMSAVVAPIVFPLGAAISANRSSLWQRSFPVVHLEATPASIQTRHFFPPRVQVLTIWSMR